MSMPKGYPFTFPLPQQELQELTAAAKDFEYSHGIIVRSKADPASQDQVSYYPLALFPSPVPRCCYDEAVTVHRDFNILMHRASHDHEFLKESLENVIHVDEFTKRLWDIYETTVAEGIKETLSLELTRSDYMFDTKGEKDNTWYELKQVEFNTMAAGMGGISPQLVKLHRYILSCAGHADKMDNVAQSDSCLGFARAFLTAWKHYNKPKSVILFLVLAVERNTYDQRQMEYGIKELDPTVKVIRRTLQDIQERGYLDDDRRLFIDGMEVSIIYQRSCYNPKHFQTEKDWETRLMIERSRAIKSPSVHYHLVGTKKIQQLFTEPGMVERFISDKESAKRIRATFTGQYTLDLNELGNKHAAMAMKSPERFVLKPQREGGGNNTFGEEIRTKLEAMGESEERNGYILMDRIQPMLFHNYPVSPWTQLKLYEMVSEFGTFGSLVGTPDDVLLNQSHGYLMRTKTSTTNEGGVMTESAVIDCPYLI